MIQVKKIDIHAHATMFKEYFPPFPWEDMPGTLISAEELIGYYDKLGIEKGILLPISAPEAQLSLLPSESCKYLADKYPDRFYWFCNVDPRAGFNAVDDQMIRLIKHYKALGAKGVGEITCVLPADHPKVMNLFDACEACDMPAIIHINIQKDQDYGIYDDLHLPRFEKVLKAYPGLKLIGHSQAFWTEISGDVTEETRAIYPSGPVQPGGRITELMRKYPNLYCDISAGSGHNALMRDPDFTIGFLEEFQDRIMYGCDICYPHKNPYEDYPFKFQAFMEEMVNTGKISEDIYRKIYRDNAIRILKLEE